MSKDTRSTSSSLTEPKLDLGSEIWGEVFEPLRDPNVFRRFRFDRELNTVTWPSGADFAPEFLYEKAAQQANASVAVFGQPPVKHLRFLQRHYPEA